MTNVIELVPGNVRLAQWRAIYEGAHVSLMPASRKKVQAAAEAVAAIVAKGEPVYGIIRALGISPASYRARCSKTLQRKLCCPQLRHR